MIQKIQRFLLLILGVIFASGQIHFDVGKNNLDVKTLLCQTSPIQLKMGSNTLTLDAQGNRYKNPYNLMVSKWKANSSDASLVNALPAGTALPPQNIIDSSDGKPFLPLTYPQFSQVIWDATAPVDKSTFVFLKLKPDFSDLDGVKIKKTVVAGNDMFSLDSSFTSDSNTNSINYGDLVLIVNMATEQLLSAVIPRADSTSNLSAGQLVNFKMDEQNLGAKKWYLCGAQSPAAGVSLSSFLGKVEGDFKMIAQNSYFVIESGDSPAKTGPVLEGDKIKLNFCKSGYYIKTTNNNNKFFETDSIQKGLIIANNEAGEANIAWTTNLTTKPAAVVPKVVDTSASIQRCLVMDGDKIALRNLKTGRYLCVTKQNPIYPFNNAGDWGPTHWTLGGAISKSPNAAIYVGKAGESSTTGQILDISTSVGKTYMAYTYIQPMCRNAPNKHAAIASSKGKGDARFFWQAVGDEKDGFCGKTSTDGKLGSVFTGDKVIIYSGLRSSTWACTDVPVPGEPVDTTEVEEIWGSAVATGIKDPALVRAVWIVEPFDSATPMKMQIVYNYVYDETRNDGFLRYGDSYALKNQINGYYIGKPNSLYGGRTQANLTDSCKFIAQPAGGIAKINDYVKSGDYIITRRFISGDGTPQGPFYSFGSHGACEDYYVDNPYTGVSAFARIYKYGAQVGDKIAAGDKIYFQFYPDTYIYGGGREVYWNTDGTGISRASAASPNMPVDRATFEKNYLFTVDAITSQEYIKSRIFITGNQGFGPKTNDTAKNCQW